MRQDHTPRQDFLPIGQITEGGGDFVQSGPLIKVMGLFLGVITHNILVTEKSVMIKSFKNELTILKSNYLAANFCTPGWTNSSKTDRWMHTGFILDKYVTRLRELGLYQAIQAIQYGISNNPAQLFALQEMYALSPGTFFIPNCELAIRLHKMSIVLGCQWGSFL